MKAMAWMCAGLLMMASTTSAGEVCIVRDDANNINGTVDCDIVNPQIWDNGTVGYRTDGPPCSLVGCLPPTGYTWSISSSTQTPDANQGLLTPPMDDLYLWLSCNSGDGIAAAEFAIETVGDDLTHVSSTPLNAILNAGTFDQLLLAFHCPGAPFLAMRFTFLVSEPVSVESESWSDVKAMYR